MAVVQQENVDKIAEIVRKVSDPQHPEYGNFLSMEEVHSLTAPQEYEFERIEKWAVIWGLKTKRISHSSVEITGPISKVENALHTKIVELVNDETGQRVFRAGIVTIGSYLYSLAGSSFTFFGLHGLPLPPKQKAVIKAEQSLFPAKVTPSVIANTYGINKVKIEVSGSERNRQAVAEFQGQYEKDEDLEEFFKRFVPNAQEGDEKVYKFVGDPDKQVGGVEASLDIQYIMGVAPHVKSEFWMYANYDFCDDLRKWTEQLLETPNPPLVHSISYGWQGDLEMVHCERAKVNVIDNNFAKLAARGVTIIFSSGDSGSGYVAGTDCASPERHSTNTQFKGKVAGFAILATASQCCAWGERRGLAWSFHGQPRGNCTVFSKVDGYVTEEGSTSGGRPLPVPKLYPSWPASSPYVTSVGATRKYKYETNKYTLSLLFERLTHINPFPIA